MFLFSFYKYLKASLYDDTFCRLPYLHVFNNALFLTYYAGALLVHKYSVDSFYTKSFNVLLFHDLFKGGFEKGDFPVVIYNGPSFETGHL